MERLYPRTLTAAICVVAGLLVMLCASPVSAQGASPVAEQLAKAIELYGELKFDEGLQLATDILESGDLARKDSMAVFAVMSMLTHAKGQQYINRSYEFLDRMAELGPCLIHLPYEFWPKRLRDRWYHVAKERDALTCPEENDGTIKTIAIMEFDNYSIGEYLEKLGHLTKGLAESFERDFSKISDLKVVERDKVDFLLKEIELSAAGMIDQSTAVRVGKLLGAQIMVFGNITQLDSKTAKMLVKAVKVETSEILATVEREGKPEYFKMQDELVEDLAKQLGITLNAETKALLDDSGTESADAAMLYSQGLYYMDQYDYKKAYEYFKKAYEADETFEEAKHKMEIYRPLAMS